MLINLIKFYQKYLSTGRSPVCRFTPSCSEYAIQAIAGHGHIKGICFSLKRLLKCHPLGPWGYDPLPIRSPQ